MTTETARSPRGTRAWLFLLVSGALIAPASLFVHDFMLETLKVPYPTTVGLPRSVKFLGELVRFCALDAFCRLSRPNLRGLPRTTAACAVGWLVLMLNETLRVLLIEGTIVGSWAYAACDAAPRALSSFVCGCAIAWTGFGNTRARYVGLAVLLAATLAVFAVHPALDALCASLKNRLSEPVPLYVEPYPLNVNVLIYVTFLEPTIAAFVVASRCWSALGEGTLRRIIAFTGLRLLVRGE